MEQRPYAVVPDVVGMAVLAACRRADDAQVVLAPPDADGPPLGALLWPQEAEHVIASQSPGAGARVRQWDSVVVTYVPAGAAGPGPAGVREPRRPDPGPGGLGAAARAVEDR